MKNRRKSVLPMNDYKKNWKKYSFQKNKSTSINKLKDNINKKFSKKNNPVKPKLAVSGNLDYLNLPDFLNMKKSYNKNQLLFDLKNPKVNFIEPKEVFTNWREARGFEETFSVGIEDPQKGFLQNHPTAKAELRSRRDEFIFKQTLEKPTKPTEIPYFNHCFDKNRVKLLVIWYVKVFGENTAVELVENLKELGFYYATHAGISLGIDDLKIPANKFSLLAQAETSLYSLKIEFSKGNLTSIEHFQKLIETWHRTSESIKHNVINYFRSTNVLNPIYMMAFSGARGNISQVRQLVGMRGLMADPQGQILNFPIQSNFREGLTLTEYIISCYGARKGVVDTALRTAKSGYLTRRLVDVAQHIVVSKLDCGTELGLLVKDLKSRNKVILKLERRLVGRVLAKTIYLPRSISRQSEKSRTNRFYESLQKSTIKSEPELRRELERSSALAVAFSTEKVSSKPRASHGFEGIEDPLTKQEEFLILAPRNKEISPQLANEIIKHKKEVLIRSPLSCQAKQAVCQLCYGWSLSQKNLVALGEAVGVIAAQSIGEPGTQLTMRTFHTGGVFSADVLDQIYSSSTGKIRFPSPIEGTLVRTPDGKIAFFTQNQGYLEIVSGIQHDMTSEIVIKKEWKNFWKNLKSYNLKDLKIVSMKIPPYTALFVRQGETVSKNQLIGETSFKNENETEADQSIETHKVVYSEINGEIYFENVPVNKKTITKLSLTKPPRQFSIHTISGLGSLWILSGKQVFFKKAGIKIKSPWSFISNIFGDDIRNGSFSYTGDLVYSQSLIYQSFFYDSDVFNNTNNVKLSSYNKENSESYRVIHPKDFRILNSKKLIFQPSEPGFRQDKVSNPKKTNEEQEYLNFKSWEKTDPKFRQQKEKNFLSLNCSKIQYKNKNYFICQNYDQQGLRNHSLFKKNKMSFDTKLIKTKKNFYYQIGTESLNLCHNKIQHDVFAFAFSKEWVGNRGLSLGSNKTQSLDVKSVNQRKDQNREETLPGAKLVVSKKPKLNYAQVKTKNLSKNLNGRIKTKILNWFPQNYKTGGGIYFFKKVSYSILRTNTKITNLMWNFILFNNQITLQRSNNDFLLTSKPYVSLLSNPISGIIDLIWKNLKANQKISNKNVTVREISFQLNSLLLERSSALAVGWFLRNPFCGSSIPTEKVSSKPRASLQSESYYLTNPVGDNSKIGWKINNKLSDLTCRLRNSNLLKVFKEFNTSSDKQKNLGRERFNSFGRLWSSNANEIIKNSSKKYELELRQEKEQNLKNKNFNFSLEQKETTHIFGIKQLFYKTSIVRNRLNPVNNTIDQFLPITFKFKNLKGFGLQGTAVYKQSFGTLTLRILKSIVFLSSRNCKSFSSILDRKKTSVFINKILKKWNLNQKKNFLNSPFLISRTNSGQYIINSKKILNRSSDKRKNKTKKTQKKIKSTINKQNLSIDTQIYCGSREKLQNICIYNRQGNCQTVSSSLEGLIKKISILKTSDWSAARGFEETFSVGIEDPQKRFLKNHPTAKAELRSSKKTKVKPLYRLFTSENPNSDFSDSKQKVIFTQQTTKKQRSNNSRRFILKQTTGVSSKSNKPQNKSKSLTLSIKKSNSNFRNKTNSIQQILTVTSGWIYFSNFIPGQSPLLKTDLFSFSKNLNVPDKNSQRGQKAIILSSPLRSKLRLTSENFDSIDSLVEDNKNYLFSSLTDQYKTLLDIVPFSSYSKWHKNFLVTKFTVSIITNTITKLSFINDVYVQLKDSNPPTKTSWNNVPTQKNNKIFAQKINQNSYKYKNSLIFDFIHEPSLIYSKQIQLLGLLYKRFLKYFVFENNFQLQNTTRFIKRLSMFRLEKSKPLRLIKLTPNNHKIKLKKRPLKSRVMSGLTTWFRINQTKRILFSTPYSCMNSGSYERNSKNTRIKNPTFEWLRTDCSQTIFNFNVRYRPSLCQTNLMFLSKKLQEQPRGFNKKSKKNFFSVNGFSTQFNFGSQNFTQFHSELVRPLKEKQLHKKFIPKILVNGFSNSSPISQNKSFNVMKTGIYDCISYRLFILYSNIQQKDLYTITLKNSEVFWDKKSHLLHKEHGLNESLNSPLTKASLARKKNYGHGFEETKEKTKNSQFNLFRRLEDSTFKVLRINAASKKNKNLHLSSNKTKNNQGITNTLKRQKLILRNFQKSYNSDNLLSCLSIWFCKQIPGYIFNKQQPYNSQTLMNVKNTNMIESEEPWNNDNNSFNSCSDLIFEFLFKPYSLDQKLLRKYQSKLINLRQKLKYWNMSNLTDVKITGWSSSIPFMSTPRGPYIKSNWKKRKLQNNSNKFFHILPIKCNDSISNAAELTSWNEGINSVFSIKRFIRQKIQTSSSNRLLERRKNLLFDGSLIWFKTNNTTELKSTVRNNNFVRSSLMSPSSRLYKTTAMVSKKSKGKKNLYLKYPKTKLKIHRLISKKIINNLVRDLSINSPMSKKPKNRFAEYEEFLRSKKFEDFFKKNKLIVRTIHTFLYSKKSKIIQNLFIWESTRFNQAVQFYQIAYRLKDKTRFFLFNPNNYLVNSTNKRSFPFLLNLLPELSSGPIQIFTKSESCHFIKHFQKDLNISFNKKNKNINYIVSPNYNSDNLKKIDPQIKVKEIDNQKLKLYECSVKQYSVIITNPIYLLQIFVYTLASSKLAILKNLFVKPDSRFLFHQWTGLTGYRNLENFEYLWNLPPQISSKSFILSKKQNITDSITSKGHNIKNVFLEDSGEILKFYNSSQEKIYSSKLDNSPSISNPTSLLLLTPSDQIVFSTKNVDSKNIGNPIIKIGQFVRYGDLLTQNIGVDTSGQILNIEKTNVTLRLAKSVLVSSGGLLHRLDGAFITKHLPLLTLSYKSLKTGDIVQGIPKIEELLEARQTKEGKPVSGHMQDQLSSLFIKFSQSAQFTPQEAARQSLEQIQQRIVDRIQLVYQSQGISIADKHLEIIVRQMTAKVRILLGGKTKLLTGELVHLYWIESVNKFIKGNFKATYEPVLLPITRAALQSSSFISSASFQETTRVLSRAAIQRKTDFLRGLKESVILGHLIPAGTGHFVKERTIV